MKALATTLTLLLAAAAGTPAGPTAGAQQAAPSAADSARVARGAYLVRTMGCHDCHTPHVAGPHGVAPDMRRALTGHPADVKLPPPPTLPPGPWVVVASATNTAWAGPWGVSFTANLTPDPETGLGRWTEETFIATMKTGRHQGKGRPVLPPMPVSMLAALSDADIRALFAYLQSLPPVHNRVPAPIDPPEDTR